MRASCSSSNFGSRKVPPAPPEIKIEKKHGRCAKNMTELEKRKHINYARMHEIARSQNSDLVTKLPHIR
eukprot:COSAG05_NODE_84_length_20716_cov_100.586312_9_plen_69_part_00